MTDSKSLKWPIFTIIVITTALMLMIAIGFTVGILSEDPDGLERMVIDTMGEEWLENLPSVWRPILEWITNDYVAGSIGIILSVIIIMGVFYLITSLKKRRT